MIAVPFDASLQRLYQNKREQDVENIKFLFCKFI
jgi:hypothetical protein